MINFYEQIQRNKIRSTFIVSGFVVFIITAAYLITYTLNLDNSFLIGAFIFALISAFSSYYYGDKIVLGLNHAIPADRKKYFDFYTVTENLSMANQTPMPKIFVIETSAMNAFATGRDPQHAVVCVTTGLLKKLNRTQLEAVIAHELSHIKNYDIRLMMIVSILIGTLSILTNMAHRSMFFGGGRRRSDNDNGVGAIIAIIGFILLIFSPLIAQLVQLAISRRREFLADASAIKLTRQPSGLIEALQIISKDPNILKSASTATASLYISNPFKDKLSNLFSTHPPINARIKALQEML
jgi:heat shock protein HtpX